MIRLKKDNKQEDKYIIHLTHTNETLYMSYTAEQILNDTPYEQLDLSDHETVACWAECGGMFKGLLVNVYRPTRNGDPTLGGISSQYDTLCLVGNNVAGVFKRPADQCLLVIKRHFFGCTYYHTAPMIGNTYAFSFGGNFVFTSDSRFPNDYPLPVHDRDMSKEKGFYD